MVANADGSDVAALTRRRSDAASTGIDWSPDGDQVAVRRDVDGTPALRVIDRRRSTTPVVIDARAPIDVD